MPTRTSRPRQTDIGHCPYHRTCTPEPTTISPTIGWPGKLADDEQSARSLSIGEEEQIVLGHGIISRQIGADPVEIPASSAGDVAVSDRLIDSAEAGDRGRVDDGSDTGGTAHLE